MTPQRLILTLVSTLLLITMVITPVLAQDPTDTPSPEASEQPSESPSASPDSAAPSLRPVPITAQPGQIGMTISPVSIETEPIDSGGQVRIDNTSELEENFTLRVGDYIIDAEGNAQVAPDNYRYSAAGWYNFEITDFVLPPGTSRTIPFSLDVPTDATPGDHVALLYITTTATDAALAELQAQAEQAGEGEQGIVVRGSAQAAVRLVHRVPGERNSRLTAEVQSPGFSLGDVELSALISNEGNTVANLAGDFAPRFELTNKIPLGGDADLVGNPMFMFPESERFTAAVWRDTPLLGFMDYSFVVPGDEQSQRATLTVNGSFMVVNLLKMLILVVGLLVVAGIVVTVLILRARGRRSAHRNAARIIEERRKQRQLSREEDERNSPSA